MRVQTTGTGSPKQWEADVREECIEAWNKREPEAVRMTLEEMTKVLVTRLSDEELTKATGADPSNQYWTIIQAVAGNVQAALLLKILQGFEFDPEQIAAIKRGAQTNSLGL